VTFLAQTVVDALSVGALYALSGLGIGLLFGIMRLINFAQSEFVTIGAYTLLLTSGMWFPAAALLAIIVVVLLAIAVDRLAFRPVRDADPATLLITSFAVSYFLQYSLVLIFGARPIGVNLLPELGSPLMIAGLRVPLLNLVTIGVTTALLGALALLFHRTRIGVEMRAAAVDFRMARLLGVRADRIIAFAFALSGLIAAMVAMLFVAQTGTVSPAMGLQLALVGFVATVIGGIGSLSGAVLGGVLVGFITVVLQALLPPDLRAFREAFLYAAVIAVLIFKPRGLFRGVAATERI
jgi:branched-chain amino acid transport system permease protein